MKTISIDDMLYDVLVDKKGDKDTRNDVISKLLDYESYDHFKKEMLLLGVVMNHKKCDRTLDLFENEVK